LIDDANGVVAGHGRLEAAKLIGRWQPARTVPLQASTNPLRLPTANQSEFFH
jgi:hypothetical protein